MLAIMYSCAKGLLLCVLLASSLVDMIVYLSKE